MKHLSLFSGGCDGFSVAAEWMGWTNIAHVEIDEWNQKLLRQNFQNSKVYGDIREFNRTEAAKYRGRIDIITGGFPCQPFSSAGKREGTGDDRYLWPEMLRTIRTIQPAFVVGENVAGLTTMEDGQTFQRICASLEDEGYTVESFVLPAASVGAWHRRDRIWIVAYTHSHRERRNSGEIQGKNGQEWGRQQEQVAELDKSDKVRETSSNRESIGVQGQRASGEQKPKAHGRPVIPMCHPEREGQSYWQAEPGVGRVVHGLPDRTHRIKALGNAVVPQIPYEIFKAIKSTFLA